MQHIEEITEHAYETYAASLASEDEIVPSWSKLGWRYHEAWVNAVQVIVNASLWEMI